LIKNDHFISILGAERHIRWFIPIRSRRWFTLFLCDCSCYRYRVLYLDDETDASEEDSCARENESELEWLTDRGEQNHLFISIRKFVRSGRSVTI